jgi:hypothetical protein
VKLLTERSLSLSTAKYYRGASLRAFVEIFDVLRLVRSKRRSLSNFAKF